MSRRNMSNKSMKQSRAMAGVYTFTVAALLVFAHKTAFPQAGPAVFFDPTPRILADFARSGYSESFEDLKVKVLGGHVMFMRTLVGTQWVFNRHWQPAIATNSCGGRRVTRGIYEYFYSGTETVTYQGTDHEADIFEYRNDRRFIGIQDPDAPPPVTIRVASGGSGGGGGGAPIGACTSIPVTYLSIRWEDSAGNWIEYDGGNGRALRYGDRNNVTVSFSYDGNGNRDGVYDHFGNQVLFYNYQTINSRERLVSVTDTANREVRYEWSANGSTLEKVIDVRGFEWTMDYGEGNRLERITDPEGRQKFIIPSPVGGVGAVLVAEAGQTVDDGIGETIEYFFDRATTEFTVVRRQTGGQEETLVFDENGYVIRRDLNGFTQYTVEIENGDRKRIRTEHNGNKTVNEYDERDNLIRQTFADGSSTSTTYNEFSRPLRFVDEVGTVTIHEYDDFGNLTRKTEGLGTSAERVTEYEYDQYGQMEVMRSVGDATTQTAETIYTYDTNGNIETETDPMGNTEVYTHDVMGNVLTTLDRRQKLWTQTYDLAGNLRTETDPLDHRTEYIYDRTGKLSRQIDPALFEISYAYDARDNLLRETDHFGNVAHAEFNENDFLISTTDESDKSLSTDYDLTGRANRGVDGVGNEVLLEYQNKSISENGGYFQVNKITYPTAERFLQYDRRSRLTQDIYLLNGAETLTWRSTYDPVGRPIRVTDPNGENIYINRDALGRPITVTEGIGADVSVALDDRGNAIELTNERDKVSLFAYDLNDRLTTEQLPLGQTRTYSYDANSNIERVVDSKDQAIGYEYDDANRLVVIDHFANQSDSTPVVTVSYGYNSRDLLTSWDDGTVSASYSHDELGRLLTETTDFGPFSLSIAYTYNDNGTIDTFTDADGTIYRYVYDQDNKPQALIIPGVGTVAVSEFEWRAPKRISLPGGTTREIVRTGLLEAESITVRDSASNVLSEISITYDPMRNVDTKSDDFGINTYLYDENHRLTSATNSELPDFTYELDDSSNRISENGSSEWVYDDNDRLTSTDTATFSYDLNGNLTERDESGVVTRYFYDVANRLIRVENAAGQAIVEYGYDPQDRRIWKDVSGVRTYFLYSEMGLVGEYASDGSQIRAYGYMPDGIWTTDPVYLKTDQGYAFYQNDELGTPRLLVDLNGTTVWSATFDPFGQATVFEQAIENPLRFPGQYFDSETGLHYNWRRYYDPATGRYITSDPIGYEGGTNLYAYVDANPINRMDPTGECFFFAAFGVVGNALDQVDEKRCVDWGEAATAGGISAATCGIGGALLRGGGALISRLRRTARPCSNSFSADTLVHTESGLVPIAEIREGDRVLSYSELTGEKTYEAVTAVISHGQRNTISEIKLTNGEEVIATSGHPVYVLEDGWLEAANLEAGDRILTAENVIARVASIGSYESDESVYNLSVENTHTFYVGETGYLAHNCRLPRHLRNKLKRIRNQTAAGGNRGVTGSVNRRDAFRLGEQFVGPGYRRTTGRNGEWILVSRDGLRQVRGPSSKTTPYSRTGTQMNFESGPTPGNWVSNVHLDVKP